MTPELKQFIEQARFYKAPVLRVAEMLPAEDAALDELVAEVVRDGDQKAFMLIMVAALSRERRLDARHLARGAMMLPTHQWFPLVARFHGDLPEPLLAAIEQTQLQRPCEALALLLAAAWCEEHRGGKLPEHLIPIARKLARLEKLPNEAHGFLVALAVRTKDSGLLALTKNRLPGATPEKWRAVEDSAVKLAEGFLATRREPALAYMHDKPSNLLASGVTVRRAVARVGRNDPCPCGSGKKYKRCCHDKDQERLHHSSEVAGLTQEELSAQPETHLTLDRLNRTDPFVLEQFDPRKVPAELERMYFIRLCAFNLFDRAATAFELLGYTPERHELWKEVMFMASRASHKDSLRRLAKAYPDPVKLQDEIYTGAALLLAEENPAELLKLLDECADDAVRKSDPVELQGISLALMYSRFRALGILVGRGAIPILPQHEAGRVFDEILNTRDKLSLSPEDPIAELVDERFAEQEDDQKKESAELRQARQKLDAKAQQVNELNESLERMQKEIARREQKRALPTQTAPTATKPPPVDELALKELRRKVEELKTALKERHHERNDLRRELQQAHTDLETLRQNAVSAAPSDEAEPDREEELLLPQDAPEVHPVRLIEFPKNFQQTLAGFPRHVARAAVIMCGRLAAGEPAAFVGALRLKAVPNVMRQRIGSDYRLLFRLHPDHLQVIDLINRKDLDRRLKTLV
jgi:hypothetical protein